MPTLRRLRRPLLAVVVLGFAAAATGQTVTLPKVDLDYDAVADFSAFKTFSWKDPLEAAKDPQMHTRIIWYVDRELEKKGLAKKPDGQGDLHVRYYAKARKGLKAVPSQEQSYLSGAPGQLTTSVDISKVVEGTLLLELQRASDGKAVWRAGSGYGTVDEKRLDADTARVVQLLLSKFPPP